MLEPSGEGPTEAPKDPSFDEWFRRDYPLVVGLCRRILDLGQAIDSSLVLAEEIAVQAFTRMRFAKLPGDGSETTEIMVMALDECLEHMVGHPGTVALHHELLGGDIDFDGLLPLSELHETLAGMRRGDRRVGLLALGAGYSPAEVAVLLEEPLDEVLARLARVSVRLADGRRIGLS